MALPNTGGLLRTFHTVAERRNATRHARHTHAPEPTARRSPPAARVLARDLARVPPHKVGSAFALAATRSWLSPLHSTCGAGGSGRAAGSGAASSPPAASISAWRTSWWPYQTCRWAGPCPLCSSSTTSAHDLEALGRRRPRVRRALELEWSKMRRTKPPSGRARRRVLTLAVSEATAICSRSPRPRRGWPPSRPAWTSILRAQRWHESRHHRLHRLARWYPNEDAVVHFVDAILPRVRATCSRRPLRGGGRSPSAKLRQAAEAVGATVTGTVDRRASYVRKRRCAWCRCASAAARA